MFKRKLFNEDHESFRDTVRRFIDKEIAPHHAQWEADGVVPRELWLKAGAAGMLCCTVPEEYGGIEADYLDFNAGRTATIRPAKQKAHLVVKQ